MNDLRKAEETDNIVEQAIQGHASTRDAIRWAMQQEREACVCASRLPKRPLTDTEAFLAVGNIPLQKHITDDFILAVVRATEAAHGIRGEK